MIYLGNILCALEKNECFVVGGEVLYKSIRSSWLFSVSSLCSSVSVL